MDVRRARGVGIDECLLAWASHGSTCCTKGIARAVAQGFGYLLWHLCHLVIRRKAFTFGPTCPIVHDVL